jgi:hypothetical protein
VLNAEHRHRKGKPWSSTSVRDILRNRIYEGVVVYGKRRFEVRGGKTVTLKIPESQWITVSKPELRIVPAELWATVQTRLNGIFTSYLRAKDGRLQGRPETTVSEHLLTGFCVCGTCGGRLVVWSKSGAANAAHRYLICWRRRSGGAALCSNNRNVPLEPLTDMIVTHFREDILTPERLAQVAKDLAADAYAAPERVAERRQHLDAELQRVESRLSKLTEAIVVGGAVQTIVVAIKAAEAQQREIEARLEQLAEAQRTVAQVEDVDHQERVAALLTDWREALNASPVVARQVLRKLLVGPITIRHSADGQTGYWARGSFGRVIAGVLGDEMVTMKLRFDGDAGTGVVIRPTSAADLAPADDLQAELLALAQNLSGWSEGTPGPTS